MNKQQLKEQITGTLSRYYSVTPEEANAEQIYSAMAMCVRDILAKKNSDFTQKVKEEGAKRVYYMCMEFLLGRSLKTNLCNLGLDTIEETADSFSIGAMVSLRTLELHEGLNAYSNNAVAKAMRDIVGVQFRNMATIGGSIFGRFGFSDVLTVFLAMDTYVELYKGGIIPLSEFASMERNRDILVRVIVKKKPGKFTYLSVRNTKTDFPVLTCSISIVDGEYNTVIGARPMKAILIKDSDGILSDGISKDSALEFSEYIARSVPVDSNIADSETGFTCAKLLETNGIKSVVSFLNNYYGKEINRYVLLTETGYKSFFRAMGDITVKVSEDIAYDTADMFLELKRGENVLTPDKTYKYMKYLCETKKGYGCSKANAEILTVPSGITRSVIFSPFNQRAAPL